MYLDSAILVKLVVRESDSVFYADMVDGQIVWSAELALSECFSALLRKGTRRFHHDSTSPGGLATDGRRSQASRLNWWVSLVRFSSGQCHPGRLSPGRGPALRRCHPPGRRRTMRFLAVVYQRHPHARRRDPHGFPLSPLLAQGDTRLRPAPHSRRRLLTVPHDRVAMASRHRAPQQGKMRRRRR